MADTSHDQSHLQPDPKLEPPEPNLGVDRSEPKAQEVSADQSPPDTDSGAKESSTPGPSEVAASRQVTPAAPASEPTVSLWRSLLLQPLLVLGAGALVIVLLGVAQKYGFISAGGGDGHSHASGGASDTRYICPMMCTPPQTEPGRCPVCAMELVAASSSGADGPSNSITIDAAARRVSNIQTVAVMSMPMTRTIRAIGELNYDEGTQRTISAYVDGRLDRLYADYTGMVVKKGDHLALLYSPRLYSGQVELLLAKKAQSETRSETVKRIIGTGDDLYSSAKQRLMELGMTEEQIADLEKAGEANSRLQVCAPISGTVIEKLAVEGEYVKEGQSIFKVADLSTVWLMLELFPEDAAAVRYGQKVEAVVQSLPDRTFEGRVAFIDPQVDPKTRTVGVRVVIPNRDGLLRVGDYAKATINVPLSDSSQSVVFDPELANKWISPRHPHVVTDKEGDCPVCGIELVPAAQLGFTDQPSLGGEALVVPRDAVLMAGDNSVVYVEAEPGRFEIRRVVLGPHCGDHFVVRSGVKLGELVATRGNFLIDSQMQLAGNPSLIDPTRIQPAKETSPFDQPLTPDMIEALAELSDADRTLAETQVICPVRKYRLGSMGAPPKVDVNGKPVFICCEGCREDLLSDPDRYLALLERPEGAESSADSPESDTPSLSVPQQIETGLPAPPVFQQAPLRELDTSSTGPVPTDTPPLPVFQQAPVRESAPSAPADDAAAKTAIEPPVFRQASQTEEAVR